MLTATDQAPRRHCAFTDHPQRKTGSGTEAALADRGNDSPQLPSAAALVLLHHVPGRST